MVMVGIITGCIVACIMTVYILKYIGSNDEIDLDTIILGNTSIIYTVDPETGEAEELQRLYAGGENRIWVDYDQISQYAKDAIVAVEDQRFWTHDGVDWKRTFGAFVGMLVPIEGTTTGGGSTITQQLIKNVTQDNEYRIERKVREIFRALDLSKRYSREEVLEAYLNVVPLGNGTVGIEAAANMYFDKSSSDLTLAESAAIVGITKYPGLYDPFVNPENNKERQEHILGEMLKQEFITQSQYDQAMNETLAFKRDKHYAALQTTQSYFVDHVINEVIDDLMEEKGYEHDYASDQVYRGGYRIYITMDRDIQEYLEDFYSDVQNFIDVAPVANAEYPQSACVILDPHGKILAMAGGIGEKEGARVLNRATQSKRQPGSSIKPLAAYALAFEYDRITWSSVIEDGPLQIQDGNTTKAWPTNYYGGYKGMMTVVTAIQLSTNTIPAKLVDALTPRRVFDFLSNELHFDSLVEQVVVDGQIKSDVNLSSMALGGMTYGVTPLEMAGGYQMYVNGGYFTEPYAYTKVLDSSGKVVLEKDTSARQVLSEETAVIINKLLQKVVNAAPGTGVAANLGFMPTAGKTGTSTDDVDQWFIGITPYYVCQVWLGYDEKTADNSYGQIKYYSYPPPKLWKAIMGPLHEDLEYKNFIESENVVSKEYCTISGLLAAESCPKATGWYKVNHPPNVCTGHAVQADEGSPQQPGASNGSGSSSGSGSGGPSIFDFLNNNDD